MVKTMKSYGVIIIALVVLAVFCAPDMAFAQGNTADKAEVPLTDPGKPAIVKASMLNGGIIVTGYSGKTIQVEAVAKKVAGEDDDEEKNDKAKGMYRIQSLRTGLTVVEENNEVIIKTNSWQTELNLHIKVPVKTSLHLRAVNSGDVKVENVEGEITVKHTNGSVMLKNISGSVVASTTNGDMTVDFNKVTANKAMSISSFNGDVDVTLPAGTKFDLKMKSDRGDIYSDFKLESQAKPSQQEKGERRNGKYTIRFDKSIYAKLNGGGEELTLNTFNGDIYIRKK